MNERIRELAEQQAGAILMDLIMPDSGMPERVKWNVGITSEHLEKFAELIVRECIDKIETHRIPVGNSAAGEMACEWTYAALKEIRDEITEHFGIDND